MTESSVNVPETARQTARTSSAPMISPSTTGLSAGLRSLGARQCPNCGAYAPAHTSVCPECGESVQRRAKKIRCLRCGGQSSSELTLCPHCGRELRPAPPRVLTWSVPVALVTLFLVLTITQWDNGNPLVWARDRLAAGFTVVGERIEPEIILVVTPIAPDRSTTTGDGPGAALAIESAYRAQAASANTSPSVALPAGDANPAGAESGVSAEPAVIVNLPTATLEIAAASEPVATDTPLPTDTPMPSATPDTGQAIVDNTVDNTVDYMVRRGDTLVTIAAQYGVDVDKLMAANDIGPRDVFVIQPGQVLVIPVEATPAADLPTATVAPSETPTPAATSRPRATATPTATAVQSGLRLNAPALLSPEDGAEVSCDAPSQLTWQRVPFVRDSDKYVLHLGFVSGRNASGGEQVVWILAQQRPVTVTEWELDESLCGLASAQNDHQWRWWVEVVGSSDSKQVPVSPPSATWGFRWE